MSNMAVKLKRLEDEESGKFEFVYSDSYQVFYVLEQERSLFLVTTDKLSNINAVTKIVIKLPISVTEEQFFDYTKLKFFKPYSSYDHHVFIGMAVYEDQCIRFKIDATECVLECSGSIPKEDFVVPEFNMLTCLNDFEVIAHIQKKNIIHLVARDTVKKNDYIYGVIDAELDVFRRLYYLYDDTGDIVLNSINIDTDEGKTRVAGYLTVDENQTSSPFFEEFILR